MYESITYAELKNLPKEQKSYAWKELKAMYSTQKELSEKLGVSPAIVYNMIARYAKDKTPGNKKVKKLESVEVPKRARGRMKKQGIQDIQEQKAVIAETKPVVPETAVIPEIPLISEGSKAESDTFSISIKKTISGEDAQFFLSGIGNTLMKNQEYAIDVKIVEK